jgi:hypothetical protein
MPKVIHFNTEVDEIIERVQVDSPLRKNFVKVHEAHPQVTIFCFQLLPLVLATSNHPGGEVEALSSGPHVGVDVGAPWPIAFEP